MKNKHLLLTTLITFACLIGGGGVKAQTQVTIGEGITGSYQLPFALGQRWSYSEFIYSSADIAQTENKDITSIAFYYIGNHNEKSFTFDLYMKNDTKSSYSSGADYAHMSSSDKYYSGTLTLPNSSGWVTITLETSFNYDYTKNLIIAINRRDKTQGTSGYGLPAGFHTTSSLSENYSIHYEFSTGDSPYDPATISSSGTAVAGFPNIQITFDDGDACMTPTSLSATPTSTTADVTWTAVGSEEEWLLYYSTSSTAPADGLYSGEGVITDIDETSYTLENLDPNTLYYVYVRAKCGESDYSVWSSAYAFTTDYACSAPTDLAYINVISNAATLDWEENGTADTWQIVYSTNSNFLPNDASPITVTTKPYTLRGLTAETTYYAYVRSYCDADNQSAWSNKCEFTPSAQVAHTVNNGTDQFANIPFYYNVALSNIKSQFIIPSSDLTSMTGSKINKLTFYTYSTNTNVNYGDATFDVYLAEVESTTLSSYYDWDSKDLTKVYSGNLSVSSNQMIISLSKPYNYQGGNLMIGFNMTSTGTSPGYVSWYGVNSTDGCCRYNSGYASEYSNKFLPKTTFTYTPAITFATAGNWNVTDNWYGNVPTSSDNVLIQAAATIPSGIVAQADNIIIGSGSLTIEDGGQLICNNAVQATVEKNISAWPNTTPADGWYFIASPVNAADYNPSNAGLITDNNSDPSNRTYDFYYLAYENDKPMWKNYRNASFSMANGQGYLYANKSDQTLAFAGAIKPYDADYTIPVTAGWNLVGNPYTFNAYANRRYYKINPSSTNIEPVANNEAVPPCTGIIVNTEDNDDPVTFTDTQSGTSYANQGNLQMVLAQSVATRGEGTAQTLDKAIVSFSEGSQLGKFYFGTQDANLYIPQDNEEYAIVSSSAQGEMPVNFKAHRVGQYTLTVNPEKVEMGYLHLIDNIAGKDIDLLANPSYTFNAKADDYESRFRLVFSANMANTDLNDDFAFFSNGQLIIANEGEATLQVIDVTGRVVATENIHGTCSKAVNVKAGVYVLRLINGTDVKTQKVVIK